MNSNNVLNRLKISPFSPLPLLSKGVLQTLAAHYLPNYVKLSDKGSHLIPLADGDKLSAVENRPRDWKNGQRIVLLVHGLTGSHRSKYMIRMTNLLIQQGFMVIRLNLRGCGLGLGLAMQPYHSGRSEDLRAVLHWLKHLYPQSPATVIGFSLGANIVLKMAGEDPLSPIANLDSVMAISPPLNLYQSVKRMLHPKNRLFDQHFVRNLKRDIQQLHQAFPQLPYPNMKSVNTIYDFDDIYTAPRSGFKNALDYYSQCSSEQFIDKINLPTFILYSHDDPVVDNQAYLNLSPKKNIDLILTDRGGHVGWLGHTDQFGHYRWMDKVILRWLACFHQSILAMP